MAEYSNKRKKLADLDDLSREELLGKLKRLVGGGLASARLNNELDEITDPDSDELKDGYQLRFVGKDYARLQAGLATETVVVPNVEHNQKPENKDSQNVFITGDNLDALKHLENSYTGQVDVIYIDPPYNTGTDGFVYQDNFKFSDDDLKLKLGLSDKELGRIRSLNGKSSHSAWLTFMYPRLVIAKRLLKDTGVIFISIDDNEQANLKILMDAIFIGKADVMVWRKSGKGRDGKMKNTTTYRKDHEYIIAAFGRSEQLNKSLEKPNWQNEYTNPDNDPRGSYKAGSISKKEIASNPNHTNYFTVTSPSGKTYTRQFDVSQEEFMSLENDNRIYWGKEQDAVPALKIFTNEDRYVTTSSLIDYGTMTTTTGAKELEELLDVPGIGNEMRPKPIDLIKKIAQISTDKKSIVLDFFAGSGTTAHAIMKLNASDGGARKYILCTIDEAISSHTAASKAGYNTIDDIGRNRIEVAAKEVRTEKGADLPANFDGGFKHYVLKKPAVQTLDKIETFEPGLVVHEDMVTPFASTELGVVGGSDGTKTLLTTWLLDDGYKFDDSYEVLMFAGAKAYKADARLYVIDQGWSTASTKELLNQIGTNKLSINTLVLYPYSFDFATLRELKVNLRTNLDEDHGVELVERY